MLRQPHSLGLPPRKVQGFLSDSADFGMATSQQQRQLAAAVGCPCLLLQLNPLQSHVRLAPGNLASRSGTASAPNNRRQCLSCCKLHFKTLLRLTPVTHDDPAGRGGIMEQCFQDRDVRGEGVVLSPTQRRLSSPSRSRRRIAFALGERKRGHCCFTNGKML